jgi:photosystem II stability/assembly factor-like uncharacterized protein
MPMRSLVALVLVATAVPDVSTGGELSEELLKEFRWRSIGPCSMGGRITDLAVVESKPQHYFVAAASGGVWKTTNNGTTWTPVFDQYGTCSIGAVAVCQSNPDIVWVGTGEANPRNSVLEGDGVYKSTDGGRTFQHLGLPKSRHIGRVRIHPADPDIVYVAALGNVWVPNPERGLYKTVDGGKTWTPALQIDENHGCIDVALDPENPDIVYAAMYAVRRDGTSSSGTPSVYSEKAGLFKSIDAGATWTRLSNGLPSVGVGRIGVDVWRKDSKVVYCIVETRQTQQTPTGRGGGAYFGITAEEQDQGIVLTQVTEGGPADRAGLQPGDVIQEFGGKKIETYDEFIAEIRARRPNDKVKVKVQRGDQEVEVEVTLGARPEEEEEEDDDDEERQEISFQDNVNRGGVYRSDDRGETWRHLSTTNPRPFYYSQVRIDPRDDRRIYVLGVQLHVSDDGGRRFRNDGARTIHVDHHAMWINPADPDHLLLGNDGGLHATYDRCRAWEHIDNLPIGQFYAICVDDRRPYRVYGGLQDNGTWGGPSHSRNRGIVNQDWSFLNGADGFTPRIDPKDPDTLYCEGQNGMIARINMRTGERKSIRPRGQGLRFEWWTPIELAPSDPRRVYTAAQRVFESSNRGDEWRAISEDLTRTPGGSVSSIALSPLDEDILWAGTNDGAVWVTRDRGKAWTQVAPPELNGGWVTRLEASRAGAGAAYLLFERRRKGDSRPYLFATADFGATWKPLTATLPPDEPAWVLREDPSNQRLLYLGTERGVYVSADAGQRWVRLGVGLPVVAVFDLALQQRENELVAGTHGRSLWVLNVSPLRQLSAKPLEARAHLFEPDETVVWRSGRTGGFNGNRPFFGQNAPSGAVIDYYLKEGATSLALEILDREGRRVASLRAPRDPGIHRVSWPLRNERRQAIPAGSYTVALTVDGETHRRTLRIVPDPEVSPSTPSAQEY